MVDWLRLAARHWFLLPPALLVLGVAFLILLAAQEPAPCPWIVPASRGSEPLRRDPTFCLLVVLDPSLTGPPGFSMDRRQRLCRFVVDAVNRRAHQRPRDLVGLVMLGLAPRLVLKPAPVGTFLFPDNLPESGATPDLGAGLRLALEALPHGGNRRILLLSDGADHAGDARAAAQVAHERGVPIDVVLPPEGEGEPRRRADPALLEEVRALTNGRAYADADLAEVVNTGLIFQTGTEATGGNTGPATLDGRSRR